uniref:Uncharacterized protein n=1 Tax=Rhipicephalus zambeziensis TaxID=60191 RepID=A0A224YCF3_9ACAR
MTPGRRKQSIVALLSSSSGLERSREWPHALLLLLVLLLRLTMMSFVQYSVVGWQHSTTNSSRSSHSVTPGAILRFCHAILHLLTRLPDMTTVQGLFPKRFHALAWLCSIEFLTAVQNTRVIFRLEPEFLSDFY